jgi:hypothetical protein
MCMGRHWLQCILLCDPRVEGTADSAFCSVNQGWKGLVTNEASTTDIALHKYLRSLTRNLLLQAGVGNSAWEGTLQVHGHFSKVVTAIRIRCHCRKLNETMSPNTPRCRTIFEVRSLSSHGTNSVIQCAIV